jgi:hypothetical protein
MEIDGVKHCGDCTVIWTPYVNDGCETARRPCNNGTIPMINNYKSFHGNQHSLDEIKVNPSIVVLQSPVCSLLSPQHVKSVRTPYCDHTSMLCIETREGRNRLPGNTLHMIDKIFDAGSSQRPTLRTRNAPASSSPPGTGKIIRTHTSPMNLVSTSRSN